MRTSFLSFLSGLLLLGSFSLWCPNPISAQGVFLGAGRSFPTGDYGEYADAGWIAEAGVTFPLNQEKGIFLVGEGLYGSNNHSDFEGDKTKLLGAFGGIEVSFANESGAGPFVFAELGILRHDYTSDEYPEFDEANTGLAVGGGGGYGLPLTRRLSVYVLGRYLWGHLENEETGEGNTTLFGLMAGVSVSLGGDG
jgi:hypothetical protein